MDEAVPFAEKTAVEIPPARLPETPAAFARAYRVPVAFVPWASRQIDFIDVGNAIADVIDALPPTRARFRADEVVTAAASLTSEQSASALPSVLFAMHGAFEVVTTTRTRRFANPRYYHYESAAAYPNTVDGLGVQARKRLLGAYADAAPVSTATVARQFGVSAADVAMIAAGLGVSWRQRRLLADRAYGRLAAIYAAWTDHPVTDIARAAGVPPSAIRWAYKRHGAAWSVPPDPTRVGAFPGVSMRVG